MPWFWRFVPTQVSKLPFARNRELILLAHTCEGHFVWVCKPVKPGYAFVISVNVTLKVRLRLYINWFNRYRAMWFSWLDCHKVVAPIRLANKDLSLQFHLQTAEQDDCQLERQPLTEIVWLCTHELFEVEPQLARVGVPGEGHAARLGLVVRVWVVGAHQVRAVGGGRAAARDLFCDRRRRVMLLG